MFEEVDKNLSCGVQLWPRDSNDDVVHGCSLEESDEGVGQDLVLIS